MPKWLKIVLIILAISFVICGGTVGACIVLAKKAGEGLQDVAATGEAGKTYGQSHTGQECLDESLNRGKACDVKSITGIACLTGATMFFQGCAGATTDKKAMCENGPKSGEKSEEWAKRRCTEAGMDKNEACEAIMSQVPMHCMTGAPTNEEAAPDEAPPAEAPAEEKPTE